MVSNWRMIRTFADTPLYSFMRNDRVSREISINTKMPFTIVYVFTWRSILFACHICSQFRFLCVHTVHVCVFFVFWFIFRIPISDTFLTWMRASQMGEAHVSCNFFFAVAKWKHRRVFVFAMTSIDFKPCSLLFYSLIRGSYLMSQFSYFTRSLVRLAVTIFGTRARVLYSHMLDSFRFLHV